MRTHLKTLTLISSFAVLAAACGAQDSQGDFAEDQSAIDGKADSSTKKLSFSVVSADLGKAGGKESRWLVTSKKGFESAFGTKAPADVKWGQEWLYIYSAGNKATGGYTASVTQITYKNGTLRFFDSLESPGPDCLVTQSTTKPYVAVKFGKQGYSYLTYTHDATTRVCDPCATVKCAAGTHCEAQVVECFAAPCPLIAECVANECIQKVLCAIGTHFDNSPDVCACVEDETPGRCALAKCSAGYQCTENGENICAKQPFCGGIAGIACPGLGECADNTSDGCDPAKGGADCGGLCWCNNVKAKCAAGQIFNDDPAVCACQAQACVQNVLCVMGSHFDNTPGVCSCVPDKVFCGGIAGIKCPGAGKCVDDPSDGCDPAKGGADCGGMCSCIQTQLCVKDKHFDSSPSVCACVAN